MRTEIDELLREKCACEHEMGDHEPICWLQGCPCPAFQLPR